MLHAAAHAVQSRISWPAGCSAATSVGLHAGHYDWGSCIASMQVLQERVAESQVSLQRLTSDQQAWEGERAELQGQLAAAKKAQAMAQSKLVLAKQREAQLKVGMHAAEK